MDKQSSQTSVLPSLYVLVTKKIDLIQIDAIDVFSKKTLAGKLGCL